LVSTYAHVSFDEESFESSSSVYAAYTSALARAFFFTAASSASFSASTVPT
jgi:hypothetical protein